MSSESLSAALIGLFTFNLRVALPLFVTRSLHGSEVAFAALYATLSCGAVLVRCWSHTGGLYNSVT